MPLPEHQFCDHIIASLVALDDLKVWSVLVTIFGDLASEEENFIPGTVLSKISQPLGIKPAALRVALHRLNKDGWITAEKFGRVSHYSLTAEARHQTLNAHRQVYGPYPVATDRLALITSSTPRDMPDPGRLAISKTTFIALEDAPTHSEEIQSFLPRCDLPDWVQSQIMPKKISGAYQALKDVIAVAPPDTLKDLPALKAIVLRVMILHCWRRIVLRHDPVAFAIVGPDWVGTECNMSVQGWLKRLPRRDPAALLDQ